MDYPSTSGGTDSSPDAKLILYPKTMQIMELCESKLKLASNLGRLKLNKLIRESWFQDNTLAFDILLNEKESFIMCVYPPGSGKSTLAMLLKYYLSSNGISEEVCNFLDTYRFQQKENERVQGDPLYTKFRGSASYVLFVDFSEIEGETYIELEKNYRKYMQKCWMACGLPEHSLKEEFETLNTAEGTVWTSLERLRGEIFLIKGNLFVILDSIDNMYNLIANLPTNESKQLYDRFTRGIAKIIHKGTCKIKTFRFGVSPYLIAAFQKYTISCYFIDSADVGEYFFYSDTMIQKVIITGD